MCRQDHGVRSRPGSPLWATADGQCIPVICGGVHGYDYGSIPHERSVTVATQEYLCGCERSAAPTRFTLYWARHIPSASRGNRYHLRLSRCVARGRPSQVENRCRASLPVVSRRQRSIHFAGGPLTFQATRHMSRRARTNPWCGLNLLIAKAIYPTSFTHVVVCAIASGSFCRTRFPTHTAASGP